MDRADTSLAVLQAEIRSGDTRSMPLAGLVLWSVAAVVGLFVGDATFAYTVLIGTGVIFPLGLLISRARGRSMLTDSAANPLTNLFLLNIVIVAALWPIAIIGSQGGQPTLVVLFAAIMLGLIWIPWGWTADDPVGLRHGLGRVVGKLRGLLLCACSLHRQCDLRRRRPGPHLLPDLYAAGLTRS